MLCREKRFFLWIKKCALHLEKHNISSLHVNNLTFRWNAARGAINSTLNKEGDRSSTGSADIRRNSKWATCSSCVLKSSDAIYIGTRLNLCWAGRNIFLLKTRTGIPVYYKNLGALPPPSHEHLTVFSVFPLAALVDRKALHLADGKLRKEEATCPTQDPTGTPCQGKGSSQLLQAPG